MRTSDPQKWTCDDPVIRVGAQIHGVSGFDTTVPHSIRTEFFGQVDSPRSTSRFMRFRSLFPISSLVAGRSSPNVFWSRERSAEPETEYITFTENAGMTKLEIRSVRVWNQSRDDPAPKTPAARGVRDARSEMKCVSMSVGLQVWRLAHEIRERLPIARRTSSLDLNDTTDRNSLFQPPWTILSSEQSVFSDREWSVVIIIVTFLSAVRNADADDDHNNALIRLNSWSSMNNVSRPRRA